MNLPERAGRVVLCAAMTASVAAALGMAGCGTPGAPQAPSLKLPDPVTDLSAERAGDRVSLTWTMPKKNTDKILIKESMQARVCRKQGGGPCVTAGADLTLGAGADGVFNETLPASLASGAPRPLTYFVELKNRKGRSAGLSNDAEVLAGEAPAPVTGLSVENRKAGIVVHWTASPAAETTETVIRLHRKLLTPAAPKAKNQDSLTAPPPEAVDQNLVVADAQAGHALDKNIRLGETYEYRAQRVARVKTGSEVLELAGPISDAVRIEAADVFPPAVPTGLAAVATAAEDGKPAAIDLSWQANADSGLAGYRVYRLEGEGAWQRISPIAPVIGPGFHDEQVEAGHTYRYAVTAIDQTGHESARSEPTEETVPEP
jgi:hypothetical protein